MAWASEGWGRSGSASGGGAPNTFGLIQNFTNVNGGTYTLDGIMVGNDVIRSWSVSQIDAYTLRIEVRSGDVWSSAGGSYTDDASVERAEVSTGYAPNFLNEGVVINWEGIITVLPGPTHTGSFSDMVQLHATTNVAPTYSPFCLMLEQNTDKLLIVTQDPSTNWNPIYTSASAITRGVPMDFKCKVKMGPATNNGSVLVIKDGVTIVNQPNFRIGATASQYYWKWGFYRGAAAETMKVDFSHVHMYIG